MVEREYLGIFDVDYIECVVIKIKATDKGIANEKFINYLLNVHDYKENHGRMYVIPLFAEIETI